MILFVCYTDISSASSGSMVRPRMMYQAFLDLGYEVLLLAGAQENRDLRRRAVRRIYAELKRKTPQFCYVELPSGPIFGAEDRKLLLYLKRLGVPCAAFYRDAYYRFATWWNVPLHKKAVLRLMHTADNLLLRRCCDIVYFPSKTMAGLFSFPRTGVLPPACVERFNEPREAPRSCIYVGGLSHRYGKPTFCCLPLTSSTAPAITRSPLCAVRGRFMKFRPPTAPSRGLRLFTQAVTHLKRITRRPTSACTAAGGTSTWILPCRSRCLNTSPTGLRW